MNLSKQDRIPFLNGLEEDVRITLETATKIGEMLAIPGQDGSHSSFAPWLNWNMPFSDHPFRKDEESSQRLIRPEAMTSLNDAYAIIGKCEGNGTTQFRHIAIKDIQPNPFWDEKLFRMLISRIKFWAIAVNEGDVDNYSNCVMAVRPYEEGYQVICHHHQLAALLLLQVESVKAAVVDLSDEQMRKMVRLEFVE